jgi:nucleotide-binding universal stress UspA family protein
MTENAQPVLLCFDGSPDAEHAISSAAGLVRQRSAVVLSVSEPIRLWQPSDPATVLGAPIEALLNKALEVEKLLDQVVEEQANRGIELARAAGFDAQGRTARGKAWKAICEVADELDAAIIVLGARGLSRLQSALLGSVSSAVSIHASTPVMIIHHRGTSK